MRYLSVCSGIEAASVAWSPLGWKPFAFSEIERFPCQILKHHYPDTPNLGDMTKYQEWPDASIDVLVGGTPCQSFSVAGLRKGLDDPRGNLMLTYGAIAGRYRPRWLVWENVPGVLSSNGGRDFGSFLGMLGQLGYGFAYRVLDAQYTGLAQSRKRVFVVGCLGDWRRAAAVLFERHSLQGNPAPSRKAWKVAPAIPARSLGGGGLGTDFDCDGGLIPELSKCLTRGTMQRLDFETETMIPVAFSCKDHGADAGEISPTLRSMSHDGSHANGGGQVAVAFGWQNLSQRGLSASEDVTPTLDKSKTPAVAIAGNVINRADGNGGNGVGADDSGAMYTLTKVDRHAVSSGMQVRRLTPTECERLQGFPDSYTDIHPRGKPTADGPRYKALGNSMATNVMSWIGKRIDQVQTIP